MVSVYDVAYPIVTFIVFAILTIPTFRLIRKTKHETALSLVWFALVFACAFAAVANLAIQYYQIPLDQSFVNIPLAATASAPSEVSSAFMIDGISIYMTIIMVAVSATVILYSIFYINPSKRPSERYFAIMLLLVAALIGAVCAGDLLTLFIFWEAAAAGSSFLMLYKKNRQSLNATLKYIVMIVIASAFIVFGLSLVYGITGTLNFWAVKDALMVLTDKSLLILAFIFIAAGYAIEAAIVPFHFWLPDAYNAAPASSSAFLSALVDQGSYYVLIRVLIFILTPTAVLDWRLMLAFMAAFTMIVGNMFALIQNNVKVLIGNICVADVGYNLVAMASIVPGVAGAVTLGLQGNLYFFLIGGITTALSFMAVGIMNHYGFKTLKDFAGIGRRLPYTSFALLIAALSFAGVPPLGGFIAKYLVFTAAIEADFAWLAVIGVIMSVVQTAYLFRLINVMYAKKPKDETRIKEPLKLLIPIFILVGAIIILGLFPSIVLDPIQHAVNQFPFMP
ncbi:MAG: NADH-quinone oxidoreductase subunit N [Candidatus Bathyarchaeota archaeon]|nr:NADH-quinone oxidoreductase subunit N [Candidatus Bathyarchaeota archaeon]